jgi:hypothetical protein
MQIKAVATGGVREVVGQVRVVYTKNDIPTGFIGKYILVLAGSEYELDLTAGLSNAAAVICQAPREVWLSALRLAKKTRWRRKKRGNLDKIFCLFEDCLSHLRDGMTIKVKAIKKQLGELTIEGRENG